MDRPPPDSPERRRADDALRRAQQMCPPEHRGPVPEVPCPKCMRRADAEAGQN